MCECNQMFFIDKPALYYYQFLVNKICDATISFTIFLDLMNNYIIWKMIPIAGVGSSEQNDTPIQIILKQNPNFFAKKGL